MDKYRQRLQEDDEDEVLTQMMDEYAEAEGEALWRAFEAAEAAGTAPEVPEELDARCRKRIGKKVDKRHDRFGIGLRRAAVIGLVFLCLMPPLVLSVDALKIPILNFVVSVNEKFTAFTFGKKVDDSLETERLVNYILSVPPPIGYELMEIGDGDLGQNWLTFKNQDGAVLQIRITPAKGNIEVDTEDADQIPMKINKQEVVYLKKEGHRVMYFDAQNEVIIDIHAFELDDTAFWRYVYKLLVLSEKE